MRGADLILFLFLMEEDYFLPSTHAREAIEASMSFWYKIIQTRKYMFLVVFSLQLLSGDSLSSILLWRGHLCKSFNQETKQLILNPGQPPHDPKAKPNATRPCHSRYAKAPIDWQPKPTTFKTYCLRKIYHQIFLSNSSLFFCLNHCTH